MTVPVFVVGSGRCGTATLAKLLGMSSFVEAHHEYHCELVQRLACLWYHRKIEKSKLLSTLADIYIPPAHYSQKLIWLDSSNKLSWLIDFLLKIHYDAKIIWLVRDGRKVTSSYYHKLSDECYSSDLLDFWLDGKILIPPPLEKKYWWPVPPDQSYDRFTRIAWHWNEINQTIKQSLSKLSYSWMLLKLEHLSRDLDILLSFLEVKKTDEMLEFIKKPHNVNRPTDYLLTDDQLTKFWRVAKVMMRDLGYERKLEYRVNYDM